MQIFVLYPDSSIENAPEIKRMLAAKAIPIDLSKLYSSWIPGFSSCAESRFFFDNFQNRLNNTSSTGVISWRWHDKFNHHKPIEDLIRMHVPTGTAYAPACMHFQHPFRDIPVLAEYHFPGLGQQIFHVIDQLMQRDNIISPPATAAFANIVFASRKDWNAWHKLFMRGVEYAAKDFNLHFNFEANRTRLVRSHNTNILNDFERRKPGVFFEYLSAFCWASLNINFIRPFRVGYEDFSEKLDKKYCDELKVAYQVTNLEF